MNGLTLLHSENIAILHGNRRGNWWIERIHETLANEKFSIGVLSGTSYYSGENKW